MYAPTLLQVPTVSGTPYGMVNVKCSRKWMPTSTPSPFCQAIPNRPSPSLLTAASPNATGWKCPTRRTACDTRPTARDSHVSHLRRVTIRLPIPMIWPISSTPIQPSPHRLSAYCALLRTDVL